MRIVKKTLAIMDRCYAVAAFAVQGRMQLFFASEGHGPCYAYDAETLQKKLVWEEPGGTMCIVPLPGGSGDFLAVQNFFPTFQSENSTIAYGHFNSGTGNWEVRTLFALPYIHRFDVLENGEERYIMACTLATSKKDKEDWSDPGKVYVGVIPEDLASPIELSPILEGLVKNHGYSRRILSDGRMAALVSCENGVYQLDCPAAKGGKWTIHHLLEDPVSDICMLDMDGDGLVELAVIEGFHGRNVSVLHEGEMGYQRVYECARTMDFVHAIWAGMLRNVPTMIFGCRRHALELFLLQYDHVEKRYKELTIDIGTGPSNVTVMSGDEYDIILSSSRHIGEATIYYVHD